jgi:DNA-binding Lrp family transcriptional regulator
MGVIHPLEPELAAERERALIAAIQDGLPLVPRPYALIGERIGMSEAQVIAGIRHLLEQGVIKRLGVVVRHRALGYRANAMVVWDVPDARLDRLGPCMGRFAFVTLCYHRPRRPPAWRYNLFTMIHGRDREQVLARVEELIEACGLEQVAHEVLFSRRCFKQCGARYVPESRGDDEARPAQGGLI